MHTLGTNGAAWLSAACGFLAMWTVMMAAMMLPSLVPVLRRYSVATGRPALSAAAGAGYLAVWTLSGAVVFALVVAAIALAALAPFLTMPVVAGLIVASAGVLQMSAWKSRQLACCRRSALSPQADARAALREGVRLGIHCNLCCAAATVVMLVLGMMDLRVMLVTTAGITAERMLGERMAHLLGTAVVLTGAVMIVRAMR